ncbi:hypothetical protein [Nocardiopsis suaedae]|uniref:Uncharacterized protein n=1 Tax=Nocardiopsis suaedae TaxID=3018444 RepID=A0ABT4TH72_9ACTN|nr:hypothetical protein [Nocardiopsis suaedae]MDA2804058.1 hypothetical protein [Nocardiopsis suaedae]
MRIRILTIAALATFGLAGSASAAQADIQETDRSPTVESSASVQGHWEFFMSFDTHGECDAMGQLVTADAAPYVYDIYACHYWEGGPEWQLYVKDTD